MSCIYIIVTTILSNLYLANGIHNKVEKTNTTTDDLTHFLVSHHSTSLTAIDVTHSNFTHMGPMFVLSGRNFEHVKISHSIIQTIDDRVFTDFSKLKTLYLDNNQIRSMKFLRNITTVRNLSLDHNQIEKFEGLDGMNHLEILDVSYNKIKSIGVALQNTVNLEELYINNNLLANLNKSDFQNLKLRRLDLSKNNLKVLKDYTFSYLHDLSFLNISYCGLDILEPKSLQGMKYLRELLIDHNNLSVLIDMTELRNLSVLDARENKIYKIDEGNNFDLRIMNLRGNNFSKINFTLFPKISVQVLILENICISSLNRGMFKTLKNISILNLNNNNVRTIKSGIFEGCESLRELHLQNAAITDIGKNAFATLKSLVTLVMSENFISNLVNNTFSGLQSLTILNISTSNVSYIESSAFLGLESLKFLDLTHNKIVNFYSNVFTNLPSLVQLYLEGNNLSILHHNIFTQNKFLSSLSISNLTFIELLALKNNPIQSMNISNSKLENLNIVTGNSAKQIYLNNVEIEKIEECSLCSAHFVTTLFCNNVTIKELRYKSFDGIEKRNSLNLSSLGIESIEGGAFINLSNSLKELNLENNKLKLLKYKTFFGLKYLQRLYLNGNDIKVISTNAFLTLSFLNFLKISYNGDITEETFQNLDNLQTLQITDSTVDIKPKAFAALKKLNNLTLNNVEIENELQPDCFFGLHAAIPNFNIFFEKSFDVKKGMFEGYRGNLNTLNMGGLSITNIEPGAFIGLENLTVLDLHDNNLEMINENTFASLVLLQKLDLSKNEIQLVFVNSFNGLSNLQYLNISHNKLHRIPYGLYRTLPSLMFLFLNNNQLGNLKNEEFVNAKLLKTLDISYNNITSLKETTIFPLENLRELNIEGNSLIKLNHSKVVAYLKNLEKINLDRNKWPCDSLIDMLEGFRNAHVDYSTTFFNEPPNVGGIKCTDKCLYIYCDDKNTRHWSYTNP